MNFLNWIVFIGLTNLIKSSAVMDLGQVSCDNDVFQILNAGIYPWPIPNGGPILVSVWGIFQQDTYVQEFDIGILYNNEFFYQWTYHDFDNNYYQDQFGTFYGKINVPNDKGLWTIKATLTAGQHIGCWVTSFNIN